MLKRANLKIDASVTTNAKRDSGTNSYDKKPLKYLNIKYPGTTPKEITSHSESSCLPISVVALNALANNPSKLSKKTPINTHTSVFS